MGNFDSETVIRAVAAIANSNQICNEIDFISNDGLLCCGKCGGKKETIIQLQDRANPGKTVATKVPCTCRCERERIMAERTAKEELERVERLKKASLMGAKFDSATFDSCTVTEHNRRNLRICKRYAENFDDLYRRNQGLLMYGSVGTGKSYAAACIANHLLSRGVSVIMTSFVKLLEMIQSGTEDESVIINRLNQAKLVIFDDLNSERDTSFAMEKLYNIVDSRYRAGKPMILTTNLSLEAMQNEKDIRYARIYDRIFETCYPMAFTGTSWRLIAANKRYQGMSIFAEEGE